MVTLFVVLPFTGFEIVKSLWGTPNFEVVLALRVVSGKLKIRLVWE